MSNNTRLKILLNKADQILEDNFSRVEFNIIRGYKKALDDVRKELSIIFADYNKYPTLTELRKFKRLDALEKQITSILANMQRTSINVISSAIKVSYIESFDSTKIAINEALQSIELTFTKINQEAIDYVMSDNLWLDSLKNHNAKLLTDSKIALETALRTNAREDIASGLARGKSYKDVADVIKERFDVTATRAKTITFTEMHKGHSKGRNTGINQAIISAEKLGLTGFKVWKHNHVGIPRPSHLALDNKSADKNGLFTIGDNKAEAPGLFGIPEEDINCHCSAVFQLEGISQEI